MIKLYEGVAPAGNYFTWQAYDNRKFPMRCVEWRHATGEYYITDEAIQDPPYSYIAGPFDTKEACKAAYLLMMESLK